MNLDSLHRLDHDAFVAALGGVFERSPWVASRAWSRRPFADTADLHARMVEVMLAADEAEQTALIRAHPELAGRARIDDLTVESQGEQRGAGLDRCTPAEFAELHALNDRYREKFGWPFILAVKGHDRASILAAFRERVDRSPHEEHAECLRQIARIAWFRLTELIG